ncbi:MAG: PAS domain-containing protein [Spirochaetota bacterium]
MPDNTVLYFRVIKTHVTIEEKKFIIVMFVDITEQVIAFKNLKKNEQKYSFLLTSVPLGLLLIDAQTLEVKECNNKALELFHYNNYFDIAGKHIQDI